MDGVSLAKIGGVKMDKNLEQFINLVKENPDLEVICMVDEEIVPDDGYSRYMAGIGKSWVDEYWQKDERIYFKSEDLEEIREDIEEEIWHDSYATEGSLSEYEESQLKYDVHTEMGNIPWQKAIILNIDL